MLAYLLKKFPRLSETFILNELLGLEGQGLAPRVFSRRPPDDEPRHPELRRLAAPVEVLPPLREMDPWATLLGQVGDGPEDLLERVRAVVAAWQPLGHPRFPSLLAEALHLLGRCRELGITHVHAHFGTDAAVAASLLEELGGPGYSLTLHAKDIYRDTVDPAVLGRLVARSRFAVTVCDANVRHLLPLLPAAAGKRLRRLYNGVDLQALRPGSAPRDDGHVLAVGRLVEKKGFGLLLEALALLRQQGLGVRLTLVGEGEERAALEARVAALGLGDVVTLAGALDQDGVRTLLGRATCLALPCLVGEDGNRDALPTVLLEAQAAGLPVVSTPVTGIPEIVDHGGAGLLVPEGDVPALARSLERLLQEPGLRSRLAVAGRARAEELFDLRRNTATLAGWLQEAAAMVPA